MATRILEEFSSALAVFQPGARVFGLESYDGNKRHGLRFGKRNGLVTSCWKARDRSQLALWIYGGITTR